MQVQRMISVSQLCDSFFVLEKYTPASKTFMKTTAINTLRKLLSRSVARFFFVLALLNISSLAYAENLSELMAEAVDTHPLVRVKMAQSRSATVGIKTARWQFFPTPSVSIEGVNADKTDPEFQGDDYIATVGLTQPLWAGGRLSAGLDKANARVAVNEASLDKARQDIALRVIQQYGNWLSASLKRSAWEKSIKVHQDLRDQVKRRGEKGVSAMSDVSLAESRLSLAWSDFSAVKAQDEVALSRLAQIVGREINPGTLKENVSNFMAIYLSLVELKSQAINISPGIRRAASELLVADAEVGASKSEKWPEIYLRTEYQHGSFSHLNTDPRARIYLGISSRFGAGLSSFSKVEEVKLLREAAVAEIEAQHRAVKEQVDSDYALILSFGQRLKALRSSLNTAENISESYGRQFLAGKKTWLDVMNAARDLANVEVQLSDAIASQLAVTWRMAVVTQGVNTVLRNGDFSN